MSNKQDRLHGLKFEARASAGIKDGLGRPVWFVFFGFGKELAACDSEREARNLAAMLNAAPAMLEALEELTALRDLKTRLSALGLHGDREESMDDYKARKGPAWEAARAAIAQAKGETNGT